MTGKFSPRDGSFFRMKDPDLVPLSELKPGTEAYFRSVEKGSKVEKRLKDLGLSEGEPIEILKNDRSGPLLICVRKSCLAMGRELCAKILMEVKVGGNG
jgi:Fe2+ transport system protein FeoA